jgi:hypothetical protein
MTPEEVKSLFQSPPDVRDLRIEVRVLERNRLAIEGSAWGPFREVKRFVATDAAIKTESLFTAKGETLNIHVAGTPEADVFERAMQGKPS